MPDDDAIAEYAYDLAADLLDAIDALMARERTPLGYRGQVKRRILREIAPAGETILEVG